MTKVSQDDGPVINYPRQKLKDLLALLFHSKVYLDDIAETKDLSLEKLRTAVQQLKKGIDEVRMI